MSESFPEPQVAALQAHAARLHDSRKSGTDLRSLARDLLYAMAEVCTYAGLDSLLVALGVDASDRSALADHEVASAALVARLETIDLDSGGARNAKPRQLVDCVLAALDLTVVPAPEPQATLGDDVRAAMAAALTTAIEPALAVPAIRDAIIADARARCDDSLNSAFNKVAAQLDERGIQLLKQPKVALDAMQTIQRALGEARVAVIGRAASAGIDRAKTVLAASDAAAAARIDAPVTLRLTPREIAILRACDVRMFKTAVNVVQAVLAALTELARIAWRAPEQVVHTYTPKRTYAVGDMIEHPKFGRGSVTARMAERIDVEFADGKRTLVHIAARS